MRGGVRGGVRRRGGTSIGTRNVQVRNVSLLPKKYRERSPSDSEAEENEDEFVPHESSSESSEEDESVEEPFERDVDVDEQDEEEVESGVITSKRLHKDQRDNLASIVDDELFNVDDCDIGAEMEIDDTAQHVIDVESIENNADNDFVLINVSTGQATPPPKTGKLIGYTESGRKKREEVVKDAITGEVIGNAVIIGSPRTPPVPELRSDSKGKFGIIKIIYLKN